MTSTPVTDGVVSPYTAPVRPARPSETVRGVDATRTLSPNEIAIRCALRGRTIAFTCPGRLQGTDVAENRNAGPVKCNALVRRPTGSRTEPLSRPRRVG